MFTFVLFLSHTIILAESMFTTGYYKAAVVEYNPILESFHQPDDTLTYNAEEYVKYINDAKNKHALIIVFPEYGLTTTKPLSKTQDQLMAYTIEVPDPVHKPNPCDNQSLDKRLRLFSCAAQENRIYVVVNLLEKVRDGNSRIIYNTNVVFNRNGTIITRYRKINLHKEPKLSQGHDMVTFTTDFDVTFGILIGYDIFYKKPILGIIKEKNVTDLIYSTAWTSETPYLQALSVQAGYGRAFGVNLLAAGLNDPNNKHGGSGIYLFNGEVAELYVSPAKSSKLLVQEVPKIITKLSAVKCNNNSHESPGFRLGGNLNVGTFSTLTENMTTHTMHSLNQHGLETKAQLCNFNGMYCCKFHIELERGLTASDPVYRMILFYGVRRLDETTVGIRSCGLISCLNNNKNSCGVRKENSRSNVVFKKIAIEGNFFKSSETYDQPITLTYDLTPITEYTYCETLTDNKRHVKAEMISTRPLTNLITFGIHGRLYDYDGTIEGIITSNVGRLYANTILMIVLIVLIKF